MKIDSTLSQDTAPQAHERSPMLNNSPMIRPAKSAIRLATQERSSEGKQDLFELHQEDGVLVVRPAAVLTDQLKIHQFAAELSELIESDQPMQLLINFERVQFFGSEGFRLLLSTRSQLRNWGGCLKICGLNGFLRSLLKNFEVHKIFDIHDTAAEARAAFLLDPLFSTAP